MIITALVYIMEIFFFFFKLKIRWKRWKQIKYLSKIVISQNPSSYLTYYIWIINIYLFGNFYFYGYFFFSCFLEQINQNQN